MPIDYKLYPEDWKTRIRPSILAREDNRCKFCNVPNGATIERFTNQNNQPCYKYQSSIYLADNGEFIDNIIEMPIGGKCVKIVLTIAHLDHDITNNNFDNLAALCQRCHLRYDAKQHAQTRKKNKQSK